MVGQDESHLERRLCLLPCGGSKRLPAPNQPHSLLPPSLLSRPAPHPGKPEADSRVMMYSALQVPFED